MISNGIEQRLIEILSEKNFVDFPVTIDLLNSAFTEAPFSFNAIMLLEFLMCVEEEFSVVFKSESVLNNGFHTVNEVVMLLQRTIN